MTSSKTFTIQIKSEGKRESGLLTPGMASITVNEEAIITVNGSEQTRGLHVALINEQDGSVVQKEYFRTFDAADEARRFAQYIKDIPVGRIVAVAVCDEASKYITGSNGGTKNQEAIDACKSLGSTQIEQLKWRDSWALIGHKGILPSQTVESLRQGLPAYSDFNKEYFLEVKVTSEGKRESGEVTPGSASISVNGETITAVKGPEQRGLHVAVINEQDGSVLQKELFKTYDQFEEATRFAQYIKDIPVGRIVAVAVCDEASKYITGIGGGKKNQEAIDACKNLGSNQIEQLNWRNSWALIGQKGILPSQTIESLNPNSQSYIEFKKRNPIEIQAKSEGKREGEVATPGSASISVNGETITAVKGPEQRGLHVAVINEEDGSVLQKELFKTYDQFEEATRFAQYIKDIPVGRIVAVAVCDEASKYITGTGSNGGTKNQEAIDACKSLGSTKIEQLKWRDSWVLIGQKGSVKTIQVQEVINSSDAASVSALISLRESSLKKIPNLLGISARISLTEDYKTEDCKNPISVYRAIISFPIGTTEAKLTAVQDIEVEIDGKQYALNSVKPVTVPTNALGKMVLIKQATELSIPAIKVHTSEMREDESYVICLDWQAHHKIANLQPDAIANNKNNLNIPEKYSAEQCSHVQKAITQLASAYQPTFNYVEGANGVCRDRYVRPHNMEHLHWKYSKESGVTSLKPEEAHEETKNAKLVSTVGQSFWGELSSAFEKAGEIVVHTITAPAVTLYKQGENVVKTVEDIATDATNTISHIAEDEIKGIVKTGNDVVHGNISGAFSDVIQMESGVVSDVFTGGENIVSDVAEGAGHALVITFKAAEEEVQYILDHTGKLGDAIKGFLKEVELEAEHLLVWLAEKLGWDDILKVQKTIERIFNDGMDKMPSIINNLKTQIDAAFKTIKTDLDSNIQQARKYFGANSNLIAQSEHDPATLDKAHEHTDWLMSKVTSDSGNSASDNFAVPEPPKNLKDTLEDLIKTLSDKVGNDTTLKNAIENLKQDFQDIFKGSLLDAPNKIILIALDLVEIIADVALDIVNTLVNMLLDCFSALLKWFQETVNTPIELPFITDIYKQLTKGEPLTLLNFTSLMIAIPAKFIAEFFCHDLASMTPSASQSATSIQTSFGYIYAACQLVNGIVSALLDTVPPQGLLSNRDIMNQANPSRVQDWARIRENLRFPRLTYVPSIIGFFTQIFFGTPSGDLETYGMLFSSKPDTPETLLEGIWVYQWVLWFINLSLLFNSNYPDFSLWAQFLLEALHMGLFITLYNNDWKKPGQKGHFINVAYIVDPLKGICQLGRTTRIIAGSEGVTYFVVIGTDFFCQLFYAGFYAKGTYDLSK